MTMGPWFEDVVVGASRASAGRTVTEADVVGFAGLSGDFCELHTNAEYAAASPFGGRIAHGMLSLVLAHGLMVRAGWLVDSGIALLGWDRLRFVAPVRIGDTIRTHWRTLEATPGRSRPDAGVVRDAVELRNQHGAVVMTAELATLVRRRP
jgi:acyl dehydratase